MGAMGVALDVMRDESYKRTALGLTIVEFLTWKELGGMRPSSLDQYERDLAVGALTFPTKDIQHLTEADALTIAKSFPARGRRVRVAKWNSLYKWAIRARRVDRNPFDALPTLKRNPKVVQDIFTDTEVEALCSLPIRSGALMQFLFDTGARKGDALKFRLRNYRTDATADAPFGMVLFLDGKGGKDRMVPATPELAAKLNELALLEAMDADDYLWWTRPGGGRGVSRTRPIGVASFDRWWRSCLTAVGVRYRKPHMTRHTMATRYLRNRRGRLETLKLVLGHESIQTTADLYGHLDMRDVAADMGLTDMEEAFR